MITRGKGEWEEVEEGKEGKLVMEGDTAWGGEHMIQNKEMMYYGIVHLTPI